MSLKLKQLFPCGEGSLGRAFPGIGLGVSWWLGSSLAGLRTFTLHSALITYLPDTMLSANSRWLKLPVSFFKGRLMYVSCLHMCLCTMWVRAEQALKRAPNPLQLPVQGLVWQESNPDPLEEQPGLFSHWASLAASILIWKHCGISNRLHVTVLYLVWLRQTLSVRMCWYCAAHLRLNSSISR